jgi:radical SAM family RiPP maturation amino acid epimerase
MLKSIELKENFHASMHKYAGLKRFFERWSADPKFRDELIDNSEDTLKKNFIPITGDDIQYMLVQSSGQIPEPVRNMWQLNQSKQALVKSFYLLENLPANAGMLAWRNRQIQRQKFDLGPFFTETNIHSSLTVELSDGCSVGCWFCALSPDSFKKYYDYQTYQQEWLQFLDIMHGFLGEAMKSTFLYWATEPFDNPDYEKFCLDVYNECGAFPPTTTAVAHKDPERIRQFIKFSSDYGCWLNRFSLTSQGIMNKVHKEFTAEELAEVECLPLNKNANFAYGNSGDFRKRVQENPNILVEQDSKLRKAPWHQSNPDYANSEDYANGSICCVTGFLVNMVTRNIQLISPTTASDEWPLGYIIHSNEYFEDIYSLNLILKQLQIEHFKENLNETDWLSFNPWLKVNSANYHLEIAGRFNQKAIFNKFLEGNLCNIIQTIEKTPASFLDIQRRVFQEYSITFSESSVLIHQLFNQGFFYGH